MGLPPHRRLLRCNHHHHHQHSNRLPTTFTAFTFLLFSSASALTLPPLPSRGGFKQPYFQREEINGSWTAATVAAADQKRNGGPGSFPPSCRSKCGWCAPCEPVHVPIHPGLSKPLEYYPEAWRCKCGNKLFMP
ncbi:EPIDERMAL PATTERNING FACTOR-like protein 5 [Prosopis cineraria]|uniref:EPIDERMAL PATTERNING FACTOR-like protein 5 n=1 Tax=Prosopis cineraria TaxID=364024 RepID=UPI00240F75B3|nr:EPIDERMAL PATTERNING FACTOR-like protein 5 [Prosopis cineraria]